MKYKITLLFFVFCGLLSSYSQVLFDEVASSYGLGINCGSTYLGNGVSFVDYNQDGWDDLTFATGDTQPVRFFKNVNGFFIEEFFGLPIGNYQTKQVNWVDIDNDGDKDLFITSDTDGIRLFENNGSFSFNDITVGAGLPVGNMFTYGASWGDINNDGFLDLMILNRDPNFTETNRLFKNLGNNTFSDITQSANVGMSILSFCAGFFDYDNDGDQDIYISNDKAYTPNLLYRNNGDETFTELGQASQTDITIDAMTVTIGDYNSDGWFDMYVTNTPTPSGNVFFENQGNGTFEDISDLNGTSFNSMSWGAVFLDAENDMDLDLYVSGSLIGTSPSLLSAAFYEQGGSGTYSIPPNAGFDDDDSNSYSNAIGDMNNDGLPEIVVNNENNQNVFLWENLSPSANKYLKIKLEGTASNRDGIGSVIEISSGGQKQFRYTLCGEGYLSQNSNTEFFGLGSNEQVDYIKISWLSGIVDYFYNVQSNQTLNIVEGTGTLSTISQPNDSFSLYPNPVKRVLHLEAISKVDRLRVIDVLGKVHFEQKVAEKRADFDLSKLNPGIYIVEIQINGIKVNRKLIKE